LKPNLTIEEEIAVKDVSPIVKSYHRQALAREGMSGDSDDEFDAIPKPDRMRGNNGCNFGSILKMILYLIQK